MGQATATAHSNMALIKYWGKRDDTLILPANSSLSMTLDALSTTTNVSFERGLHADRMYLNEKPAPNKMAKRVFRFMDHIRSLSESNLYAIIRSTNTMPTAAGLASSASGFAALAAAATCALDLQLDSTSLSRLARLGSGSACRSVYGGFAEWQKGDQADGMDSYAVPVVSQDHWNMTMLITSLSSEQKAISSREGMNRCIETSPFYSGWLATVETDLRVAKEAILTRDFDKLGRAAESNALKMHAVMLAAEPPFTYWQESTLSVMKKVWELRESGVPAYFTLDAGPNVAVLCENENESELREVFLQVPGVNDVTVCHAGPGISIENEEHS